MASMHNAKYNDHTCINFDIIDIKLNQDYNMHELINVKVQPSDDVI